MCSGMFRVFRVFRVLRVWTDWDKALDTHVVAKENTLDMDEHSEHPVHSEQASALRSADEGMSRTGRSEHPVHSEHPVLL